MCVGQYDHYAVATVRDLLGILIDGAVGRGGRSLQGVAVSSPAVPRGGGAEHNALCERINATLNLYVQVLSSRTVRRIIDDHAE